LGLEPRVDEYVAVYDKEKAIMIIAFRLAGAQRMIMGTARIKNPITNKPTTIKAVLPTLSMKNQERQPKKTVEPVKEKAKMIRFCSDRPGVTRSVAKKSKSIYSAHGLEAHWQPRRK